MQSHRVLDALLVTVARRVRDWADRVLIARERAIRGAPSAPQPPDDGGHEPVGDDGPPAEWLALVRARAPQLLATLATPATPAQAAPWHGEPPVSPWMRMDGDAIADAPAAGDRGAGRGSGNAAPAGTSPSTAQRSASTQPPQAAEVTAPRITEAADRTRVQSPWQDPARRRHSDAMDDAWRASRTGARADSGAPRTSPRVPSETMQGRPHGAFEPPGAMQGRPHGALAPSMMMEDRPRDALAPRAAQRDELAPSSATARRPQVHDATSRTARFDSGTARVRPGDTQLRARSGVAGARPATVAPRSAPTASEAPRAPRSLAPPASAHDARPSTRTAPAVTWPHLPGEPPYTSAVDAREHRAPAPWPCLPDEDDRSASPGLAGPPSRAAPRDHAPDLGDAAPHDDHGRFDRLRREQQGARWSERPF